MELNQKSSNFSDLTCLFNNGLSLVTSKNSLINRLNRLNHLLLAKINNKKKNLKVLVNEQSSVKSNLLRILNFLDFIHVCNIIISSNEKSILKCKYRHKNKLSDFIPGYEVNLTRFSHDLTKLFLIFLHMS